MIANSNLPYFGVWSTFLNVDDTLTPGMTRVTPNKGGTMGGTTITIDGNGFGTVLADVSVTIFDVPCDVSSVSDTVITCVTNAFPKDRDQVRVVPSVFIKNGPGNAVSNADREQDIQYWFVDFIPVYRRY